VSRSADVPAAQVCAVRKVLKLSQAELAERLGVSRRTIIRGERRGIELPSRYGWGRPADFDKSPRGQLPGKWAAALKEAERSDTYVKILGEVSQRIEREQADAEAARVAARNAERAKLADETLAERRRRHTRPKKARGKK
jgi:transcriptional regulator with XRE-family HTH domain